MSNRKPALTSEEAEAVEARFREELEAEHEDRVEAQKRRETRSKTKLMAKQRERQILAEEELKQQVRAKFYVEKGYKLYTDSAGREHWLTPEEYEWRMRMRARHDKNRRRFEAPYVTKRRRLMMYGGAALLAVATGLVLII